MNKEGTWSLDILYKGFDDPKLEKDFAALEEICNETNHLFPNIAKC